MTTLSDRLCSHFLRTPERIAVYLQRAGEADLAVSYRELVRGSNSYVQSYLRAGINPGEIVILILQHDETLLYSFWGAILHGAVPAIMPYLTEKLSSEHYRADLAALLEVTKPVAVVTYPEFAADVQAAVGQGSPVRSVIITDQIDPQGEPEIAALRGMECRAEQIALLQHSSGSTGLQKGVALSHQAIFHQLDAYSAALNLVEDDVIVSWLPLYHDMGLIAGFLLPILSGVPLVLSSPFDWVRAPYRLLQAVSQYRGTLTWLPNFAYNFCAQKIRERSLEGVDLSSWRALINCSEPVRPESHTAFVEVFMFEQRIVLGTPGRTILKLMSCGAPIRGTRIQILDEQGRETPDGIIGEVAIQSDCMLTEYFHRPDLSRAAIRGGWYFSGDLGFLSDGELYVSGRKKDMIIVGGKNIYPQDLEALTYEIAGVHAGRSVAFGIFDDEAGTEEVVIIAEADSENDEERERIADLVRGHVTKNSAIALRLIKIVGPGWILKTSSGKTARTANREKYLKELAEKK